MPKNSSAKTDKKATAARPRKMLKPPKANAQEDKHDARDARLALQEAGPKGSISWAKLKRELGI
jgi:hypothetical protein